MKQSPNILFILVDHYLDRYSIGMDVTEDSDTIKAYGFDHVFQVVDHGDMLGNHGIWDKRYFQKKEQRLQRVHIGE